MDAITQAIGKFQADQAQLVTDQQAVTAAQAAVVADNALLQADVNAVVAAFRAANFTIPPA